jgi:hypothetical protein
MTVGIEQTTTPNENREMKKNYFLTTNVNKLSNTCGFMSYPVYIFLGIEQSVEDD